MRRRWPVIATGCAVALSAVLADRLLRDEPLPLPPVTRAPDAIRVEGLKSFLVRKNGLPLWKLSADSIAVDADGVNTQATHVKDGTWFKDGKPYLKLTARTVRLRNATNDLMASGGIVASGPSGFHLVTSSVLWTEKLRSLFCDHPVRFQVHNWDISTAMMNYHVGTSTLDCGKKVVLTAPGARLTAGRLTAELGPRRVTLSGGVELVFDPRVAKAPALSDLH